MSFARRAPYTLWEAAFLTRHESFTEWYKGLKRKVFKDENPWYDRKTVHPTTIDDIYSEHNWKNKIGKEKVRNVMTTFTVGIHPTPQQKVLLDSMLRTSNHAFNWCKQLIVEKGVAKFALKNIVCKSQKAVLPHLRLLDKDCFFGQDLVSLKASVCEDFEAMKYRDIHKLKDKDTCFTPYTGSFKVKKECVIPPDEWKSQYSNLIKSENYVCLDMDFSTDRTQNKHLLLRLSKPRYKLPPFDLDFRIVKEPGSKFRLHVKCHATYTRKACGKDKKTAICGIDPGGDTFATVYDPSYQKCYQVGFSKTDSVQQKIKKYDESILFLQQATTRGHKNEMENRRRQLLKLKSKIDSSVKDLHVQFASMLVCQYGLVSLGKIPPRLPCIRKDRLYIPLKKNRDLYLWNHDHFRVLLKHRSLGENCHVVVQNEDWTSKTCGKCGKRNHKLGKNKIFRCDRCFYQTNRDINGARNILRKTLGVFF